MPLPGSDAGVFRSAFRYIPRQLKFPLYYSGTEALDGSSSQETVKYDPLRQISEPMEVRRTTKSIADPDEQMVHSTSGGNNITHDFTDTDLNQADHRATIIDANARSTGDDTGTMISITNTRSNGDMGIQLDKADHIESQTKQIGSSDEVVPNQESFSFHNHEVDDMDQICVD